MDSQIRTKKVLSIEDINFLDFIPFPKSRLEYVDLIIECKDREGNKIRYGVERSVLTSTSKGFYRVFNTHNQGGIIYLKIGKYDSDIILSYLKVCHGCGEGNIWTMDKSSDLIDLAYEYGCDLAVEFGINKFYTAFSNFIIDEKSPGFKGSRTGNGAFTKSFSIWLRAKEKDLFCHRETLVRIAFTMGSLTPKWFKLCELDIQLMTYADVIELDDLKLFTDLEYEVIYQYITRFKRTTDSDTLCIVD